MKGEQSLEAIPIYLDANKIISSIPLSIFLLSHLTLAEKCLSHLSIIYIATVLTFKQFKQYSRNVFGRNLKY